MFKNFFEHTDFYKIEILDFENESFTNFISSNFAQILQFEKIVEKIFTIESFSMFINDTTFIFINDSYFMFINDTFFMLMNVTSFMFMNDIFSISVNVIFFLITRDVFFISIVTVQNLKFDQKKLDK